MDIKKIAEYTLQKIRETGADMGRCSVKSGATTEIYYESGKISMIRTVFSGAVRIGIIDGQCEGTAALNSFDTAEIDAAVAEAYEASRHAVADEAEGISELTENRDFVRGVREPDRAALYGLMRGFIDDTARDYPKISFDSISVNHGWSETCYMNTNGVELYESNGLSGFGAMFMGRDGEVTSSFNSVGGSFADTSVPLMDQGLTRQILAETELQTETVSVEGKFEGEIIMPPHFFEDVIYQVCGLFITDNVLIDGTSPWKDALGTAVAAPILNVVSRAACDELPGASALASDGYIAADADVIRSGELKTFLLSRYGAKKLGKERCPGWDGNLCVEPGTSLLEDMIKGVKKGLLVNRFSGGSPAPNGDFTGVAKNSFLIEDGKITRPVSETMISGNFSDILKNITEISCETVNNGSSVYPWAKTSGVTVSGK
ncbi:MAG: TldD/PmbA family protein [Clostridia bacterium]|nr:TldD/PmbA family protein [Clostridia bacterium]